MTLEEENKQLKTENALLQVQMLELTQRLLALDKRLAQTSIIPASRSLQMASCAHQTQTG